MIHEILLSDLGRNNNFRGEKKKQPKNHDNPSCVSNLNWNCYSAICNTYCHIKVILLYFLLAGSAPVTKQQILGFEGIFGGELELSWKIQGHNSLWSWKKWNFFRPDVTKLWEFGCFPLISNPSGVSAAPPPSLHENIIYKHAGTFTFFPFFLFRKISKWKKLLLKQPICDPLWMISSWFCAFAGAKSW